MSWSHQGHKGSAQNKTPSAILDIPLSASVDAGDLLVVWTAWDNDTGSYAASASSNLELMAKVTDTQGNRYTQLVCQQRVGEADGVRGALYVGTIRNALTTSDTVTIHSAEWWDTSGPNDITAKCASMHAFRSTLSGWARAFAMDSDASWLAASGDVPDLSVVSDWRSEEHLILHMLAVEGPDTDAYTWDSDYTQITGTGTTGGADAENVHIRGGWRIATVTGDTISITSTTADRDLTHAMVALNEVEIPDGDLTFPQFELLDDFNRADQNPLSASMWLKDPDGGGWGTAGAMSVASDFQIVGNELTKAHAHEDSYGKYLWQEDHFCRYAETWATLSGVPDDVINVMPVPQPVSNPGRRGLGVGFDKLAAGTDFRYEAAWFRRGKFQVDDLHHFHFPGQFFRTMTYIGPMTAGHKIGLQMIAERYLHSYIDVGSGWEWLHCHDVAVGGSSHVYPYPSPARSSLRLGGKDVAVDDFGGGNRCFPGDIMRRVRG